MIKNIIKNPLKVFQSNISVKSGKYLNVMVMGPHDPERNNLVVYLSVMMRRWPKIPFMMF